jgi:hypothetical protein
MVPFYKVEDAMTAVEKYVKWLNENITFLPTAHNAFKNEVNNLFWSFFYFCLYANYLERKPTTFFEMDSSLIERVE